ncbi:MAG: hypothetical protein ACI8W8_002459 [Rhodothermales bacterium]|jgi:hypothetical protein
MIDCTVDGDVLDIRAPSVRKSHLLAGLALLAMGVGLPVYGLVSGVSVDVLIISIAIGIFMFFAGILLLALRGHTRVDRKQALLGIVLPPGEALRRARALPKQGYVSIALVYSGFEVTVHDAQKAPVAPVITLAEYADARKAGEAVASLLCMALHDNSRGDVVIYSPNSVRQPLQQTLPRTNGKLPEAPEVNRVEVDRKSNSMTVRIPPRVTALHFAIAVPAAGLWTLALGAAVNGNAAAAGACVLLWTVVFATAIVIHPGLLSVAKRQLAFTRITVAAGKLSIEREWPNKKTDKAEGIPLCELRELFFIPAPAWGMRPSIVIVTPAEVITVADHLTEAEATYACALIRSGISAAS